MLAKRAMAGGTSERRRRRDNGGVLKALSDVVGDDVDDRHWPTKPDKAPLQMPSQGVLVPLSAAEWSELEEIELGALPETILWWRALARVEASVSRLLYLPRARADSDARGAATH